MGDNVPAEWAEVMVKAGFTDGRYRTADVPSIEKLAAAARKITGLPGSPATYTVSNLIFNRNETSPEAVDAVRQALGLSIKRMQELLARRVGEEFRPHPSARLLSEQQKRIVNQVIAEFARGQEVRDEREQESKPTSQADVALAAQGSEASRSGREGAGRRKPRARRTDQ